MKTYAHKLMVNITIAVCFIVVPVLVIQSAGAEKASPVTIDELMGHLGFDKAHRAALLKGKILSTGMPEMEKLREELAVAAVMLVVKAPLKKVVAAYLAGESFQQNSDIIEYKQISTATKGAGRMQGNFKPIGFSKKESSEVKKLLGFKGGATFNLSQDEIKQLQAIDTKDSAVRDKVSALFGRILDQRYQSYFGQGLEAVNPYYRGKGKHSFPRKELTVAVGSTKLLEKHFPDFYHALLKYPADGTDGVQNIFYWFKQKMNNRPMFQLSHYMAEIRGHYAIMAEVQFYVEHTYNSMLTVIGCVPYEGRSLVFCVNRTFTDQITGFGSSLKRSVGRRRIEDALSEHFANLRTALESSAH